MEVVAAPTGLGYVATDNSTYATLALLLAAGKTAFPGLEAQGEYPSAVVLTSIASGGGSGSGFQFRVNTTTAPTIGVPVQGGGQQFVEPGINGVNKQLISNIYIVSKEASSDTIYCSALYG